MVRLPSGYPDSSLLLEQLDCAASRTTPQLIAALLASAQRALPPTAMEAEQYIIRACQLLQVDTIAAPPPAGSLPASPLPLAPWLIGSVERWIEAHLGEAIRIEQLAGLVNLSRSHFSRMFHRTMGESALSYIRRRRVERAQQLMLTTSQSLAQIALDCGLADQCHLTRVFRRVAGTTPASWRRQQRAGVQRHVTSW
jgi:AraC family transcriptional regulator